jgi:chemotaxis protein methyltransferase CheR
MTDTLVRSPLDDALDYFTAQTGLVFPAPRRVDFDAGARRAMTRRNMRDLDDLPDAIRLDRRLLDELIAELAVHESYFFREPRQFEAIRRLVLPQLQRERGPQARFNIWSAGCAKGEEPYSLAILLEQEGLLERCRVRATDISRPALAEAAKARYSGWSFRGTQAAFDRRYFRQRGASFHLEARIRDRVAFEVLNLVSGPYASPPAGAFGFDLILCRNVLIYFEAATVASVAGWLYEALGDGGWLITAPADPPLWDYAPFETQTTPEGIFYRRRSTKQAGEPRPAAPARSSRTPLVPAIAAPRKIVAEGGESLVAPSRIPVSDTAACLVQIKALANAAGSAAAERLATASAALHPTSPELHYLRAVLLLDLNRRDEALTAVQQVLYLDRTLVAAHLLLGSVLRRQGDLRGASRAYRNALRCCADHAPDDLAAMTDGERVERLAALAAAEIATLEGVESRI